MYKKNFRLHKNNIRCHRNSPGTNHKVQLYDYSEFCYIESGADFKFPIHDDTPNKLLSGVIYLKPNNNNGTIFYKNKGDGKKEIEWKTIERYSFLEQKEQHGILKR